MGDRFFLPWVYMHTVKDYVDLIKIFQEFPVKHTVNVVPSLLRQVDAYLDGLDDPVTALCRKDTSAFTFDDRRSLIQWCRTAQLDTMIAPLPRFRELYQRLDDVEALSTAELLDLQVSLLLAWTGPVTRTRPEIRTLLDRTTFDRNDLDTVLNVHRELLASMISTLIEAERSGQIEISVTPFNHPILPLLIDSDVARESMPRAPLPSPAFSAPDDAHWQITRAITEWHRRSGRSPRGMWPSEGSLSTATLSQMSAAGIGWTATDSDVLRHSLGNEYTPASPFLQYEVGGEHDPIVVLFRDHGLSDAIGFEYAGWEADAAADDFLRRVEERRRIIIQELGDEALAYATIPVILDGENCWEFYRDNGAPFLRSLLARLSHNEAYEVVTCSEAAAAFPSRRHRLPKFVAGSWIRGTFDIWIGTPVKNQAWAALQEARDAVREAGDTEELLELVRRCEASDWFWWYDDRHQAPNKTDFDHVYREHLRTIFERLGRQCSIDLSLPFSEATMGPSTGSVSKPISFSKQSSMHEAEAITNKVTLETDGNWQRMIVHFQRPLLEAEEVMITVTDRHHGERYCCVVHDDVMFRTALHDEGFERLQEGIAIYVHTTTVWYITIEEQRASGNEPKTTITFDLDHQGAG